MSNKKAKVEETATASQATKSSTVMDLILPLRILITPLNAFKQLAQKPTAKGLLSLVALILLTSAAAQYAFATKIVLTIDYQHVGFVTTSFFTNWFPGSLLTLVTSILMYWLIAATGLALISKFFRGSKEISLRASLVILGYLLSVFIVLWAVRTAIYFSLPSITFPRSDWPPTVQVEKDEAANLLTQNWGPLLALQVDIYFAYVAFAWLVLLGAIAVKNMREISWTKSVAVSITGFLFTIILFGPP